MLRDGRRHPALAAGVCTLLAATLLLFSSAPAGALPPAPPNPSDQDLNNSQSAAESSAAEVGRLSGLVTRTQGDIDRLRADLETKGEQVKKSMIDAQLAAQDVVEADDAASTAAKNADAAGAGIDQAQNQAAAFAAASFRQGSILGSMSAFLDAGDAGDLLSRDQLIRQISAQQLDVIANLQTTRNQKANLDSTARFTADEARAAKDRATAAQSAAEQAQKNAAVAFRSGQAQLDALQVQLQQQQADYETALSKAADLKGQRQQYETWLAAKKAEEERLRLAAEARARAAAAAAAAQAAAEQAAADQLAAEQAAAARAAVQAAAAQAAADRKAAADKAAADRAAAQRTAAANAAAAKAASQKAAADKIARQRAAESRAAAEKAARSKAAADRAAAARAAAAKAAADRKVASSAAALAAARRAQQTLVKQVTKEQQQKDLEAHKPVTPPTVHYASCADAEAAGAAPIKRGDPGYRVGLDRNGNGVACETLPDSATHAGGGSTSTGGGSTSTGGGSSRNDAGGSSPGAWSAAKGQAAVEAAVRWVGTPYSWGGGNSSGPTTGICGPDGAWNDCNIVGFDCSGLTAYAWAQEGISIPAFSVYQFTLGQHIDSGSLLPGDLMFYANDTSDSSSIHHVTMYMGNGQMVEAPYSGAYVHVTSAEFGNGYIGATRPGT